MAALFASAVKPLIALFFGTREALDETRVGEYILPITLSLSSFQPSFHAPCKRRAVLSRVPFQKRIKVFNSTTSPKMLKVTLASKFPVIVESSSNLTLKDAFEQ